MRRRTALTLAVTVLAAALTAQARVAGDLELRFGDGQLAGLTVDGADLPSAGPGGFYVKPYRARPGPNILRPGSLAEVAEALPAGFSIDAQATWRERPTLAIKLPDEELTDSGELELFLDDVRPHHIYLLRFAHRGERLGGDFPPIIHVRQFGSDGKWVAPQQNIELLHGTYDWREETIAIPAVDGAQRMSFMLHHPRGLGRFWIGGLSAHQVRALPELPLEGEWTGGARPLFAGTIPGTEVSLDAECELRGESITVHATLSAPTRWLIRQPQALTLGFRLPLSAAGWRWGDSLRRERPIEGGRDYSNYQLIGRRQLREVSKLPLAAVSGPDRGVALMVPLTPTTMNRLYYDSRGFLCVEFDLGLAVRAWEALQSVALSFDIAVFDPRWGGRAALERYYEGHPEHFASDAKQGGWWIGPSEQVEDLGDFGLQYAELHFAQPERTKANDEQGLYTCSYSEPWMWRIRVSEKRDVTLAQPLTHYFPQILADADLPGDVMDEGDYWPAPRRESVRAFLNSVIVGSNGKYQINAVRTYGGGTFIEMNTSPLPGIWSHRLGGMNRGLLSYRYETLADIARCLRGQATVDGVYFDSTGDWSDIAHENHRVEHFWFTQFPLTFSYATGTPIVSGLSSMSEYMEFIREKGFITMANSGPEYCAYAAPYLDMIGAGENFGSAFASDENLSHDRCVAFQKSVSFGNTGMLDISPEEAESRLRLLLFYNVYPGIFARDPAAVERLRPLYRRYIPFMQAMSRAGWEPVPWATVDDPAVWLERYGPGTSGELYYALRNPTEQARTVTLTVECSGLGWDAGDRFEALDALSSVPVPVKHTAGDLLLKVSLPPQDTVVVRLRKLD
jgi:hypothetical protein